MNYPPTELYIAESEGRRGTGLAFTFLKAKYIGDMTVTLLIPDRDRDNRDDFVWCLPVTHEKWAKWAALADKFNGITPEVHGAMKYVNRVEGGEVRTVLIMPEGHHSDDDVVHACAFLRMTKGISCRIFCIRSSDHTRLTNSELTNKVVGTDPIAIRFLDDPIEGRDGERIP